MPSIPTPSAHRNIPPRLPSAAALTAVLLAVGVFGVGVGRLVVGCNSGSLCDADTWGGIALLVVLSFTIVLALVLGVVIVCRGRSGLSRRRARRAVAGSLAAALVIATPATARWDDGCNSHEALVPLAAHPVAVLTSPEAFPAAYAEFQTLMLCSDVIESPRHGG